MKKRSSVLILSVTAIGLFVGVQNFRQPINKIGFFVSPRTPASTPPKENKDYTTKKNSGLDDIKKLEACYQSSACDFPQTDPRSYDIALGHKIAERTKAIHEQLKKDPSLKDELTELARHTIKINDGFVQSAALDIFKDLPISAENLQALSDGLQNNTDPLISEKALTELQRYLGTTNETKAQSVVQTMLQGAHFSSQKVGENILSFINEQSFASYQQIQQQLPQQSRVARDLQTALSEYRKQQSGG